MTASNPLKRGAAALTVLALAGVPFAPESAKGCFMRDDVPSLAYEQLAAQYEGKIVWVKILNANGVVDFASGWLLDNYNVVTTAHAVLPADGTTNTILQVGTSLDFNSPTNGQVSDVVQTKTHPGFNRANALLTTDLAVVQLSNPLICPTNFPVSQNVAPEGELCTHIGFGRSGTVSGGGVLYWDGKARGFQSYVFGPVAATTSICVFYPSDTQILGGNSLGGDSGSMVVNSQGEVVMMAIGASGQGVRAGLTISLQLAPHMSWITENLYVPLVGQSPILQISKAGTNVAVSWGDDATGYTLQATEGLNPPVWVSIGNPIVGSGQHQEDGLAPQKYFQLIKP